MKRKGELEALVAGVLIMGFILAVIFIATRPSTPDTSEPNLKESKEIAGVEVGETFDYEQRFTEKNQKRLMESNPAPPMDKSLERQNLIERYELLNDEDKIFYVYLVSYGRVMAYYTAKGKISSVNSRLTQQQQVLDPHDLTNFGFADEMVATVDSPQLDGSYGTNGDGIFFFTTEGAYVEWNGEYMVSDQPLALSTAPELVRKVE